MACVLLVEDYVSQAMQVARPQPVVWQYSDMQHVRIGKHDTHTLSQRRPRLGRSISIKRLYLRRSNERRTRKRPQAPQLVLR